MPVNLEPDWMLAALGTGIGATLAIDLWAQLLRRVAGIGSTDWGLVGRWVAGVPRGRFRLATAVGIPAGPGERGLGWAFHYAIGILYAFVYLGLLHTASIEVSLLSALLFGLVTVLAPWLILLPALGKGMFARAAPNPGLTRLLNLATHLLFGAGLYLTWYLGEFVNH